ncbi:Collagen alpha-6(VI) chain [Manis javanica]|nr:Collagen alpha-6(VI) chain [Manis javanica]
MQRRGRGPPAAGSLRAGHALERTLARGLLAAPRPERALFAIVAGETSSWDREKLRAVSLEAKCQGITLFVLALGRAWGPASPPSWPTGPARPQRSICCAWKGSQTPTWPTPGHSRGLPESPKKLPEGQFGISGFADDLEALGVADSFLGESRKATITYVTQQ